MVPFICVLYTFSHCSVDRFPISVGMVPVNGLLSISNCISRLRFPIYDGMDPLMLFSNNQTNVRSRWNRIGSKEPVNLFCCRRTSLTTPSMLVQVGVLLRVVDDAVHGSKQLVVVVDAGARVHEDHGPLLLGDALDQECHQRAQSQPGADGQVHLCQLSRSGVGIRRRRCMCICIVGMICTSYTRGCITAIVCTVTATAVACLTQSDAR
mmetsp:Transcript_19984/g.56633  ORF Transcript_19984/g.56633 Transcript_19984/m.56633 type:complete len:209 (-) Transcript_19984:1676-2302(-)